MSEPQLKHLINSLSQFDIFLLTSSLFYATIVKNAKEGIRNTYCISELLCT